MQAATRGWGYGALRSAPRRVSALCVFAVVALASVDAVAGEDGESSRLKATQDTRRSNAELDAEISEVKQALAAEEAKVDDINKTELYTAVMTQPIRMRLAGDGPPLDRGDGLAGGLRRIDARIGYSTALRKDHFFLSVGQYTSNGEHIALGIGGLHFFGDARKATLHPYIGFRSGFVTREFSSVPFGEFGGIAGLRKELSSAVMVTLALEPVVIFGSIPGTDTKHYALDANMAAGLEFVL